MTDTRYVPGYMPYTEAPIRAEAEADEAMFGRIRLAPWPKICGGSWASQHDNPGQVADCPWCAPGWDEPPC